jgi:hypothetical protein
MDSRKKSFIVFATKKEQHLQSFRQQWDILLVDSPKLVGVHVVVINMTGIHFCSQLTNLLNIPSLKIMIKLLNAIVIMVQYLDMML